MDYNPDEKIVMTMERWTSLYGLIEAQLDGAIAKNDDPNIEAMTHILSVLQNLLYQDEPEEDDRQALLFDDEASYGG